VNVPLTGTRKDKSMEDNLENETYEEQVERCRKAIEDAEKLKHPSGFPFPPRIRKRGDMDIMRQLGVIPPTLRNYVKG
jgi:hypothetical protein